MVPEMIQNWWTAVRLQRHILLLKKISRYPFVVRPTLLEQLPKTQLICKRVTNKLTVLLVFSL